MADYDSRFDLDDNDILIHWGDDDDSYGDEFDDYEDEYDEYDDFIDEYYHDVMRDDSVLDYDSLE